MKEIKQLNKDLPNSIKIGYVNYQFDFWPNTFASTEEAQGEFFQVAGKIGLKEGSIPSVPLKSVSEMSSSVYAL